MPRPLSASAAQIWIAAIGAAAAISVALITSGVFRSGGDVTAASKTAATPAPRETGVEATRTASVQDDSSERIGRWLFPSVVRFDDSGVARDDQGNAMPVNADRLEHLRAAMRALNLTDIPIADFLHSSDRTPERLRVIQFLQIR